MPRTKVEKALQLQDRINELNRLMSIQDISKVKSNKGLKKIGKETLPNKRNTLRKMLKGFSEEERSEYLRSLIHRKLIYLR